METQLRIMRDAEERQEASKALLRFQADQKRKDADLRRINQAQYAARPHSNGASSSSAAVKGDGNARALGILNVRPSRAQDRYKRWQEYDVEAALAEASDMEDESLPTMEANRADKDELMEAVVTKRVPKPAAPVRRVPPPPTDAIGWKERGNELFKRSDFQGAKAAYTRSIELERSSTALANRAAVSLRLGEHSQAEADSTEALELDSAYVKAWHRRGCARKLMGQFLSAAEDFEQALRREPTNQAIRRERVECIANWRAQNKMPPDQSRIAIPLSTPLLKSATRTAAAISEIPADKLRPSETSSRGSQQATEAAFATQQEVASHIGGQATHGAKTASSNGTQPLAGVPHPDPRGIPIDQPADARQEAQQQEPQQNGGGAHVPAVKHEAQLNPLKAGIFFSDRLASVQKNKAPLVEELPPSVTQISRASVKEEQIPSSACNASAGKQQLLQKRPPRNGIEFETAWRSTGADLGGRATYLRLIDPAQLPALFKQSLTGPVLAGVLETALGELIRTDPILALALLEGLTVVPRFSMAVLLLSRAERANIVALWDVAQETPQADKDTLARLAAVRGVYKL